MIDVGINIHRYARGQYFKPTIFERTFRPHKGVFENRGSYFHMVYIPSGQGLVRTPDGDVELPAPALYFIPEGLKHDISLSAGTDCYLLSISTELLMDVIGDKAESVLLRIFVKRPTILCELDKDLSADIHSYCRGFVRELFRQSGGSWMALAAFARLALIEVWRNSPAVEDIEKGQGEVTNLLQSFRQLVEANFRIHLPVSDYADQLGLTHDRLHAICKRILNRTPIQLIHERMTHEAKLRLERSSNTIQQVAHQLGYSDSTYFSHFFKRQTGYAPGEFRRLIRQNDSVAEPLHQNFADWP